MIGSACPPSASPEAQSPAGHHQAARPATSPVRGSSYERLLKRADFVAAQRGRRHSTPLMTVQGLARADLADAPARLGLTVTRKVGTATERNRIKRRLRAALRLCAESAQVGVDYVIVARRDLLAAPFASIVTDLENAMSRLGQKPAAKPTPSPDRPR
ncbi:ribonuclease P protein component [Rhizobiales bacterium TNE-4]|nr:ribonuclease P protein component [Rhizobiales bacterium TNE-4]MBV1828545.1 ribonuclease P protein component [Rhizobiales bacterium TNE-4]